MLSPIVLFAYNRPGHTQQTVEALGRNLLSNKSDLIIYSDGPKSTLDDEAVRRVRNYLKTISGFKSVKIVESPENKGLANSIINGVTEVLRTHETTIVLEDDMVTSPFFLDFMNQALTLYEHEERVISIHGYVYPVKDRLPETFFLRGADCWGWATWKKKWSLFEPDGSLLLAELKNRNLTRDFDMDNSYGYSKMLADQIAGLNNSWAIRWHASAFLKDRVTLYPGISFVNNIGHDDSGTHSGTTSNFDVKVDLTEVKLKKIPVEVDIYARSIIAQYLKGVQNSLVNRITKKVKSFFN